MFGAPANLIIYALLLHWTGVAAGAATVIAASFVIVPKFVASKYWVWKARHSDRVAREVGIYFAVTIGSLAVATMVALILEAQGATNLTLIVANVATFAVMWVARFLILDLFGFVHPVMPAPA